MKRLLTITVLATCVVALTSGAVLAQGGWGNTEHEIEALHKQLEYTDLVIERARETVRATNAPAAGVSLKFSEDLQEQAWKRYNEGLWSPSLRLTKQARNHANKAMSASQATQNNQQGVQRKLEQVTEMAERVRESLAEYRGNNFEALVNSTTDNLNRAREFYRSGQHKACLVLCEQVEKALRKMGEQADKGNRERNRYQHRYEAVGDLVDKAGSEIGDCGSESALRLQEQARQTLRQAEELAENGRYGAALRSLQQAQKMAGQAVRECQGAAPLENRYDRLKAEADRLLESIPVSETAGRDLLQLAFDQLGLASEALSSGQTNEATAALKAAELTLRQLRRLY